MPLDRGITGCTHRQGSAQEPDSLRAAPIRRENGFTIAFKAPSLRYQSTPEHDPEEWKPVFRKIMLKQEDEIMIRFREAHRGARATGGRPDRPNIYKDRPGWALRTFV
ncbi:MULTISPECIES: hypothetical protein [Bradyrhizobium]|uniref:Uncharacterized protein n=1 Tax=Bradyrhizobium brasilense TaxID=1419277 RepID=A0ABY8JE96_9BRAD|nr:MULTISPECIES: hypothetical protein [Bradyrhizobium]MCP1910661.1 hypothetical protein [Bradyrhizobium elkanii]MCP1836609.1 hypothetical protein [Bradyrhizobium sp. USDA 4545]MCP1846673.1 hypothetical protein [Bradyrhizobium sp. USDA 4541]MCP1921357.1 hypothetical protein [Bradyrhizobium sp. USDA 4532]WFU63494.1 hypothetical protein QA636_39905 [Bradyrhizobium brasilense]